VEPAVPEGIISYPGAYEVWGLVYDVSHEGLTRLDVYEEYPHLYTRFQGAIDTVQGILTDVWIYTVVDKQEFVAPSVEYVGIIQRAARHFAFPAAYRALLDSIATR